MAARKAFWSALIGAAALVVTFRAQLGGHSAIHELLAALAMWTASSLVLCSAVRLTGLDSPNSLKYWRRAIRLSFALVAACWLAVFFTDSFFGNGFRNIQHLLAHGEWIRVGR